MKQPNGPLSIGFLYDDTLDSTDGVAQYVKTLGAWLSARGHKVSYLVGETESTKWHGGNIYSLSKNLKISWAGNRMSIPLTADRRKIKKIMGSVKFDVLHVQVPYSPFMSQLVINQSRPATAVVGTVHVFPSSWLSLAGSKLLRQIYGKSLKRFDLMLGVSSAVQLYAKKAFRVDAQISPNVIDLSVFKIGSKRRPGQIRRIVFLGRLVERKGCEYLLRAFKLTEKQLPDTNVIVAGDGPDRKKLEKLSRSLGINHKTVFLGRVSEKQKVNILAGADIACFPSLYGESFGIVLIEAMAAGAQVVLGGNNPGYSSVLGRQKELLIDPRDEAAFAARLRKLLRDKALASELHKWQLAEVRRYDVALVGPRIEAIYRSAIVNRARNRHN